MTYYVYQAFGSDDYSIGTADTGVIVSFREPKAAVDFACAMAEPGDDDVLIWPSVPRWSEPVHTA